MAHPLPPLAFWQLITPPFRAETNVPAAWLPVYAATTPVPPPFLPYRSVSYTPSYPTYQQLRTIITADHLSWIRG
ncbi:hypothetical protein M493_02265 [Geobacillus genomosp. 3]|uniref:Uncharacterized protein n=1 Tax=Geobacillus genomosp. 3 TaxID=1921421 RepID=S5Z1F0_GEOG3|nr:hypothetical protein [Geobacillus genomosp. 3]AGT30787.1 hypothetical protein M493_02265 [Geobacillus genomosp. 3]